MTAMKMSTMLAIVAIVAIALALAMSSVAPMQVLAASSSKSPCVEKYESMGFSHKDAVHLCHRAQPP